MGNKGAALISVILVLLTAIVLLNALMAMTVTEVRIAMNEQCAAQALYLAEAGSEIAVNYLYDNPSFRGELLNLSAFEKPIFLGAGTINSVRVETVSPNVRITSEGEVDGIKKKVAYLIRITVTEDEDSMEVLINQIKWQYAF